MWTFIDINTGNAFNGEAPYVFWYENGQSVNLNYVKQLCIYTNTKFLNVHCESPVFSILKMDQSIPNHARTNMEAKDFIDLDTLKVGASENYSWVSTGYEYHGNYVHMLYFLANSQDAGEFIDTFDIDEVGTNQHHTYAIGADFYAINEIFQSNLENFAIDIPESIQRAIYEENIHEESNDNILLNRKYKELLMNYWDIIANKGSYDSLINSLKWFEWGDLVHIGEIWKSKERHGDVYKIRDLQTQFDYYLRSQIRNLSKTTYIGLYYALQEIELDSNGQVVYQDTYNTDIQVKTSRIHAGSKFTTLSGNHNYNLTVQSNNGSQTLGSGASVIQTGTFNALGHRNANITQANNAFYNEEVPQLNNIIAIWNNLDICLKMTLLGNFYQTFFMPIHLDLIHSTMDSWVFANVMKMLQGSGTTRMDYFDSTNTFDLEYEYE